MHIYFHYIRIPTPGIKFTTAGLCKEPLLTYIIFKKYCIIFSYFFFLCVILVVTDDYLIVAEDTSILHMSLNGSDLESLHNDVNGRAYGIDYHFA